MLDLRLPQTARKKARTEEGDPAWMCQARGARLGLANEIPGRDGVFVALSGERI